MVEKLDHLVPVSEKVKYYQGKDYSAYQTGPVRIYFSPWLSIGFSGIEDESRDGLMNFYQSSLNDLAVYFRKGLVDGQMFYENYKGFRKLDSKWQGRASQAAAGNLNFKAQYSDDTDSYEGLELKIIYFEEEMGLESAPFIRLYNVWVQLDKAGDAWGEIDQYMLLITLPNGDSDDYLLRYDSAEFMSLEYNLE